MPCAFVFMCCGQAFSVGSEVGMSEWLSGSLELPPGAIKDSEHVSLSTQVYVVAEGQPDALELAIAMPSKKASGNYHGGGGGGRVERSC